MSVNLKDHEVMEPTIIYDPIRSETRIGDLKISDQMLAEMGMSIEDLLKVYDDAR